MSLLSLRHALRLPSRFQAIRRLLEANSRTGVAFPAVHAAIARLVPRSQCPVPSEGGGNIGLFLRALGV